LRPDSSRRHCAASSTRIGLRQDAPADRNHGVGGEDEAPRSSSSSCTDFRAASALARASRLAQARGSSPRRGVSSDVGRAQRVRLDAGLVEQRQAPWRAGSK